MGGIRTATKEREREIRAPRLASGFFFCTSPLFTTPLFLLINRSDLKKRERIRDVPSDLLKLNLESLTGPYPLAVFPDYKRDGTHEQRDERQKGVSPS